VSAQEPDNWTTFEEAQAWADRLPGHALAFTIPTGETDENSDVGGDEHDPHVLIDYDDARDPETGAVHPTVRDHLARAESYADVSTSRTGVHIVCRGRLPEGVKAINSSVTYSLVGEGLGVMRTPDRVSADPPAVLAGPGLG
jgi:hypothetical protein